MTEPTALEQHLAGLIQVGQFDPPASFAEGAVITTGGYLTTLAAGDRGKEGCRQ